MTGVQWAIVIIVIILIIAIVGYYGRNMRRMGLGPENYYQEGTMTINPPRGSYLNVVLGFRYIITESTFGQDYVGMSFNNYSGGNIIAKLFPRDPNTQPVIFIGSVKEAKKNGFKLVNDQGECMKVVLLKNNRDIKVTVRDANMNILYQVMLLNE